LLNRFFDIKCFARTYAAGMMREMGGITKIPSILLEFFIISSYNNCVITIRILKGDSMVRPEIKNLTDLNDYLLLLEDRIAVLEQEDRTIKGAINEVNHTLQNNNQPAYLPVTGLLSRNFFTRAFAFWGHYIMASLILSLIFSSFIWWYL